MPLIARGLPHGWSTPAVPLWSNAVMEPQAPTPRRMGMSSRWGAAAFTLAILCGGCSSDGAAGTDKEADDPDAAAVWFLAPTERLSPDSLKLQLEVTQVSCNDGKTNPVRTVSMAYSTEAVTITVSSEPVSAGAHNCQGGRPRAYAVELDEPIGKRRLVDGQCSGGNVRTTAWCDPDGVRYDPAASLPTGPFEVRGRILLVGGPAGTVPIPARGGEVRFTGPVTRMGKVTRSGDFVVKLPPGTYDVDGRTPGYLEDEWACSAPRLTVTEQQYIDIVCPMR